MAKDNKSNDSSSSSSNKTPKASAPGPSKSKSEDEDEDSKEKKSSKTSHESSPPASSPSDPPSHSPPPSPSLSPPPPPPKALPASKGSPSQSPPPPPPPKNINSPPPPPTTSQSRSPPHAPIVSTLSSISNSQSQNHLPPPQSPPPSSPGTHSKVSASTVSPPKNHATATSTSTSTSTSVKSPPPPLSNDNNVGQYVGFALAAAFALAFVAVIFYFVVRKKDKRGGNAYGMPPLNKPQMKGGDLHYYVEEAGYYNGNRNHMHHLRSVSDPVQQQHVSSGQIVFSYEKIVEITNRFSVENVIGEGGFGRVYKASMPDGRVGAVKLLKVGSGQGEREFRAEVDIISRIHHRHLVSLIGYCIAEQQRVLIYDYVPNGNLDQHLHGKTVLDWPKRLKVAIGAARGLAYLHEGCNPKIIHRDIKSANILLDNAYEAQVADFGLAKLTDDANTHVSTRVMGTFGYMAPEYATSGKLTDRSDVFSFGVVLLELVTGRKPVDATQPVGDESLVEWARPHLLRAIDTGDFSDLVDPRLERHYIDSEMFKMIEAAAACVRHSAPKRPSMVQIARALDCEDKLSDLSNGVKYGQSTIYNSAKYNEEIIKFRRMANGSFSESDYDMYSTEYNTREMSRSLPFSSGSPEVRPFQGQRNIAGNMS